MPSLVHRPDTSFYVALFGLTIFLSAFLLFQVQPLVSKAILPWFGGGPAVWTAAMLFFQCTLFGGYLYAHALGRLGSAKRQAAIHLGLLVGAALLAVWVVPDASLRPQGDEAPVARILLILAVSVGLPYFCLATTGPLLQHWYARSVPQASGSVWRLYALSNVGSLLALLSFPYVFEPWLDLTTLARGWMAAFWVFALACGVIAFKQAQGLRRTELLQHEAMRSPVTAAAKAHSQARKAPSWRDRLAWVMLPALASLVFIATTDHASHDIAPEPRLWILMLSLYLLSFIVSFDHPRWYRPLPVALVGLVAVLFLSGRHAIPELFGTYWGYGLSELRWLHGAMLGLVCLVCHGELYRRRPADIAHLTQYYLAMSLGGACGGLFVALVATHLFDDYHEWPLALAAAAAVCAAVVLRELGLRPRALSWGVAVLVAFPAFWWDNPLRGRVSQAAGVVESTLDRARNFYGVVAVKERRFPDEPSRDHRVFYSGQITHGIQYLSPDMARTPLAYYAQDSGAGETLRYMMSRTASADVALVGLGVGTLSLYARPSDRYDVFEINPEVVRVAQQWFGNLAASQAGQLRMIVGDARLKFEQLPADRRYDVIVLDAFSGGSVPVHLLTREAFEAYAKHLKPDGLLVVHITNAYLNLFPVVMRQAEALGMSVRSRFQDKDPARFVRENQYVILTRDQAYLREWPSVHRPQRDALGRIVGAMELDIPGVGRWTDHFSSITPLEWRE
jgi:predicted O-methyltransferase YrrM